MFRSDWKYMMRNRVAPEIDAQLGAEALTVTPTIVGTDTNGKPNVNVVRSPQPGQAWSTCGIFNWRSKTALNAAMVPVVSRDPCFRIGYHALAGHRVGRGDHIRRDCTGDLFEVTSVHDDGVSCVEVDTVQFGRHRQGPHPNEVAP